MKKALLFPFQIGLCTFGCFYTNSTQAQVTSDPTINTQVNQNGNVSEITGGETRDGNLFHSFQDFSVGTGNEAFFNNANDISNIFSRVTGGNISNIDGLIRANGSASLFLINPAGIIFGENASLDLGGSFYGSTASSILFEDGEFSAADLDNPPLLTVNAPIGFGFRDNPGNIVNRSVAQNPNGETNISGGAVGLQVPNGATLALVGGNVLLNDGNLSAKGGQIEIGSVLSEGKIEFIKTSVGSTLSYDLVDSLGNITIQNTAVLDVTANGGGNINISAQDLSIDNSFLYSGIANSNSLQAQAGDIKINVNSLTITNGGFISNDTNSMGNAGSIFVNADSFISIDNSFVYNDINSSGNGNAGGININTKSLSVENGGAITNTVFGKGNGGNLIINASESVTLSREDAEARNGVGSPGGLLAQVELDGEGQSGDININTNLLSINDGSKVQVATFGIGNAGNIDIKANSIEIFDTNEFANNFTTGIFASVETDPLTENAPQGEAGNINIETNQLNIKNGGRLSVSTTGSGNAGNLSVYADKIELEGGENSFRTGILAEVEENATGQGGNINLGNEQSPVGQLNLTNGAVISTDTNGEGDAGNITINSNQKIFLDNSNIFSEVNNDATGDAGTISFTADEISVTNESVIGSRVFGGGQGGNINIGREQSSVGELKIIDGSQLSVSVFGEGSAGNLSIYANNLELGKVKNDTGPRISADVAKNAIGSGGNLVINVDNLEVTEGGQISASTLGEGDAGLVNISANTILLDGEGSTGFNSGVFGTVEPSGTGNAGGINIKTTNLTITNGAEIDASTFGLGNGGGIVIEVSDTIKLDGMDRLEDGNGFRGNSGIFAQVETDASGDGGSVDITSGNLIINNNAEINVGSESQGVGGSLFINTDSLSLDSGSILSSTGFGQGGNIELAIAENLTLRNSSVISAQASGNALGGNLTIDSKFVIAFPDGNNDILASAEMGQGGNITINTESLLGIQERTPSNLTNDINANSQVSGLDGTISISTPDTNPIQGATELPTDVIVPEETSQQACEANRETVAKNGLNIKGKGGIPPAPDLPLNSHNITVNGQTNSTSVIPQPIETSQGKIQPARGIKVTESGKVILTAYRTNNSGERIPEIKRNCGGV